MRLGLLLISAIAILSPAPEAGSPTVSALVHRFESAYRSSKTLQANFLETYFDGGKVIRAETGVAYFAKPGKMRWQYDLVLQASKFRFQPSKGVVIVDGDFGASADTPDRNPGR